ncbi:MULTISPECIES: hypothetical protein [Halobacteriovorax]|uniref:Flagella basal body P-ring formation protein FlgA C-terminal domain-containing protein n=1 Tax=Halobacteriovorax vibrionivorans TaxID=2152716 RepID=A0ABY0IM40_9BACT|nr:MULTISPECIES: hypothetical protein [Halobacteriovorax]AYF43191.1 hypothetical protein BALOs_0170 [Halobacteriovorax sp. BALOs_7]RZF23208.1 hypothetical protein DAY19_05410 [Halobacteriovorax vibrionivorans]TGD46361.1 hypothetical protein EP118_12410 [Halobacteriovorax sp. Y22]
MKTLAHFILVVIGLTLQIQVCANDYMIYSVEHELPMTNDVSEIQKNYYVNIGEKQGIKNGTLLDVYRIIILNDPYDKERRYRHKMKVGQLEVIHHDGDTSIAITKNFNSEEKRPILEISSFMVGDQVSVNLN